MPPRTPFTSEHDNYLVKYLATYCPTKEGRSGLKVFQRLVANEHKQWPWSVHHTWQSWRERYVKHADEFDAMIRRYQRKHGTEPRDKRKRPAEPMPIEMLRPHAKRVKRAREEEEEESSSGETREATQQEHTSPAKPNSTPKSKEPSEPPETPSQAPTSTSPRRTTPATSPPRPKASLDATSKPTSDSTAVQTRHDRPETSSPVRPATLFTDKNISPPRHVKRIRVRLDTPSDVFASEPPSPAVVEGPSPSQSTPSAPNTGDGISNVYPRAPPRVVDSLHGQVLVDREGHVPRALPHGEKDAAEEEQEEKDKPRWPPARNHTAKQKRTSGPDVKTNAHHAFSQPQPRETGEQERGKGAPMLDPRIVVALLSGKAPHDEARAERKRRQDVVRNGASPTKRIVTTAPPSDPFSGDIPKPLSNLFKLPAPRFPSRPEPPARETRRASHLQRPRHSALSRIRRQSNGNGNRHDRRDHKRDVPSVDLVALSSSISARSHSRSSADTSVPARPSRWSLPAFAQATPWVFDAPDPGYSELWRERARTTSLIGTTSTPRFTLTPSPARSIAPAAPPSHAPPSGSPTSLAPHPPDLQLTASHGLASILAHMSVNHGLALNVVEAVYARVGSLREADEVLKGMREAAEGFGEREIERRVRARRGSGEGGERRNGVGGQHDNDKGEEERGGKVQLRYVVASEDGEGSEYSPPETSRAAMWKRQSESGRETGEEDEEAEEGREVEEELQDRGEHEDEDVLQHVHGLAGEHDEMAGQADAQDAQHPKEDSWEEQNVVEALLDDARLAREVERTLGKGRYRREILKLFR